jgi:ubiquinone/menaquinone biosynthesis C-methylase UbiE
MFQRLSESDRRKERRHWTQRASAWERWETVLQHSISAVNPVLLRELDLEPGQRVVDFGCGSGDPTLGIAPWVGPRGSVVGIDISPGMLAAARRRARILRIGNVRFRRADIARVRFDGPRFDRLVSRFSLMFADDVGRALECMVLALKRGGRAAIAVWGPIAVNPGTRLRAGVTRPFLREPPIDPEQTPHPMRLARPGLLPRLMKNAGFTRLRTQAVRVCWVYPSLDDFVEMQVDNSIAELYETLSRTDRRRLRERLRRAFRRFESGEVVRYPGQAWVVSGTRA